LGNKQTSIQCKIQNELKLLSVEPAVKNLGNRGVVSERNMDGGDGPGDNGGSRGDVFNSSHRGAENRGSNCGRVKEGCGNRGGSTDKGSSKLGCSNSNRGFVDNGADNRGGNLGKCSLDEGCGNMGRESYLGCYSNGGRGSNSVEDGLGNNNWGRGCGCNGVNETILIQIFTESFKGKRPEAFGGCN
jgi:hypothetical protein